MSLNDFFTAKIQKNQKRIGKKEQRTNTQSSTKALPYSPKVQRRADPLVNTLLTYEK